MTITLTLDEAGAIALATVFRRVAPCNFADTLTERGVAAVARPRAADCATRDLPGEPGSLADIGRQRFEREQQEYRTQREPRTGRA